MRDSGFYDDVPEAWYHGDRETLSVSGAKLLLKAPALFKWRLDNPEHKDEFDLGSAAHKIVLGAGPLIAVIDAPNWMTKAAKEARDLARAADQIPLLAKDYQIVCDMAEEQSNHRLASKLLTGGKPEVSAYAPDEDTGVMRRCRFDYLRDDVIVDYKSAVSSEPGAFARAAASFGYHSQHAWYFDVAQTLGHTAKGFLFVVQEKSAPYMVTVCELVPDAVALGRHRNNLALQKYRDCVAADLWPAYTRDDEITPIDLPRWAYSEEIA